MDRFTSIFIRRTNGIPAIRWWWKSIFVIFFLSLSYEQGMSDWRGIVATIAAVVSTVDMLLQYRSESRAKES